MKMILFASALALSTAAIAQDTTAPAAPPAADQTMPAAPPAAPDATAPAAAPATPDASAPAAAPMAPAAAPSAPGNADQATQAAQSTDDSNLPACSKSVTDKCVQKGGKGGSGHHAMKKHAKK